MTEFVSVDDPTFERDVLSLGELQRPALRAHMRLYRAALALMVVLAESQRNRKFRQVRTELEKLIFPMPKAEGMALLNDLKRAMQKLNELLHPAEEARQLTWAMSWLREAGMEETNPATLTLVAVHWMDSYVAITRAVRELA